MKKKIVAFVISVVVHANFSTAQPAPVIAVIQEGITRVIKAVDLKIQRLQTKTIWLQNAEKELENTMTALKLDEISGWIQKQKDLYQEYYNELWQVKQVIRDYDKVKDIFSLQARIDSAFRAAFALFKQDKNFSPAEINWMLSVSTGIVHESLKNTEQVLLVVTAFVARMSDGERLKIIDDAHAGMQKNYNDLKQFNSQNIQLSLQRAAENSDVGSVKKLYGLQ